MKNTQHKHTGWRIINPVNWVMLYCLLIGLCAAAPLWGPGIINTRGGGDSPFLLQRTLDMAENIKSGAFPPRWMAHAAYNYGYPFFNYYGALPYYISGALTLIGFPVTVAIQSTQTLGFVLAACTMALWAKKLFSNHWAYILAVSAYTFTPYHMVNVFVRGDSLSEFYAFIWFPLILWALHQYLDHKKSSNLIIAAVAYSGLILTHNTSVVAFSPFALLYAILISLKNNGIPKLHIRSGLLKDYIIPIIAPFIIGILLTAWFWLPALMETGYGQLGSDFTEGYFHYSTHYRGLNLIQTSPAFDYSIALQAGDAGPFSMSLVQTILVGLGVCILLLNKNNSLTVYLKVYLLISLILSTLIITPLSSFLWDNISLLSITQFPWRFLAVQAVYTSAIIANIPGSRLKKHLSDSREKQGIPTIQKVLTLCMILLFLYSTFFQLHPDRLPINSSDISWDKLDLYETFTGNIGTTIRYEYLPKDVVPRPYVTQSILDGDIQPQVDGAADLQAILIERNPQKQKWEIHISQNAQSNAEVFPVIFPLYWWPGWHVEVDGSSQQDYAYPGSGQLAVDTSVGSHTVVLSLKPTKLQWASILSSAFTAFLVTILCVRERYLSHKIVVVLHPGFYIALFFITVIPLLLPFLWYHEYNDAGTYFDFDQMPFPHAGPIDFQNASLIDSDVSAETAFPDDEIDILLRWSLKTQEPLDAVLSLVSPAEHRHNVSYTLKTSEFRITPESKVKMVLPGELSRGLYLLQLKVYAGSSELFAISPQGHGYGTLFIGAIRVAEGTTMLSSPDPLITFRDLNLVGVQVTQPKPDKLQLSFTWTTPGTPRNWSLSMRLLDMTGKQITQRDTQPGYGFLPTSIWHKNETIFDSLEIDLPAGLAPGEYQIHIISYLQATGEVGGEVTIPAYIDKPTLYDLRNACCEQTRKGTAILCQLAGIALLSVDRPAVIQQGQTLTIKPEWNVISIPNHEITAQWALQKGENTVVSSEKRPLAYGSNTSTWPLHTWVVDSVNIAMDPLLASGSYQILLSLYDGFSNEERCVIGEIELEERARTFDVPSLPHQQQAVFGNEIKLIGYDTAVNRRKGYVEFTLWWLAEAKPHMDYKRFIHIYDLKDKKIITQDDAMPRDWTYPTTWWDKGEIVSETVSISLANIAKGTYRVGIGWYEPESLDRLDAVSSDGEYVQDDMITLKSPLIIR